MSKQSLAERLLMLPGFRQRIDAVTVRAVRAEFSLPLDNVVAEPDIPDWRYLLLCASLLAQVDDQSAQDAALRIATTCLADANVDEAFRRASAVVLDELSNGRAVLMAVERGMLSAEPLEHLPLPLATDAARRFFEHSVTLSSGERIAVNKFQKAFWDAAGAAKWLSVTAPTSAGKSYVMKRWIEEHIRGNASARVLYIVPTRALVDEVERDIRRHMRAAGLARLVTVSSVPSVAGDIQEGATVHVFTQERYHLFVGRVSSSYLPTFVVVDEAQKVDDGSRGMLLQLALDDIARRNPLGSVILASPSVENPQVLLDSAPHSASVKTVKGNSVTVNQNLIWASQVAGDSRTWKLELSIGDSQHVLGRIVLPGKPTTIPKKLAYIAWALGSRKTGTIVYVNGPAEAETVAHLLAELSLADVPLGAQDRLDEAGELVEVAIHPKYSLARTVRAGVGFHYGNMPLLVRATIESLFKEGYLRFLVCTSTLIEGVNLPCQTIVVRGPKRGKAPMGLADFWNLAGRAGRWGYEFQGNVVCVDPKPAVWKGGIPTKKVNAAIVGSARRLSQNSGRIRAFVRNEAGVVSANERREIEAMLSYVCIELPRGGLVATQRIDSAGADALGQTVSELLKTLEVPQEVVEKNPGISPLGMQRLLDYFSQRQADIRKFLPVGAEDANAANIYVGIFGRISKTLDEGALGSGLGAFRLAVLVTNWMRGQTLPRLINDWIKRLEEKGRAYSLQAEIRTIMRDVEQVARFQAPRLLSCYIDLYRHHVTGSCSPTEATVLLEQIPDRLAEYLEYGVSLRTQLSLLGIGMARTTAILVSGHLVDDNLTIDDCLSWLLARDLQTLRLPALVRRDLERAIGEYQGSVPVAV